MPRSLTVGPRQASKGGRKGTGTGRAASFSISSNHMGALKARSDLKFMRQFATIVPMYANALDDLERALLEGSMMGPVMGALHGEQAANVDRAQAHYFASRQKLNSMINRASQITRDRGIMSPYHELLVSPGNHENYLWRGSALPQNVRIEINDALDQTLAACYEYKRAEFRNLFNPFHHLANLIRLILHPLASLFGKYFETVIKLVTPAVSIALVIWVLRLFSINFDIKDILKLLGH